MKKTENAATEIPGMFEGPVLGLLVRLSLPIFVGMVFQLLYAVVDTLWVSRIDPSDPSYLGGMGIIFPLVTLVIAVGSGVLVGTSSLVARAIGEKAWPVLDRTAGSGLVVGLGAGVLLLALGYVFDEEIIWVLGVAGVWLGVVTGNVCTAMVTFLLVSRTLKKLSADPEAVHRNPG